MNSLPLIVTAGIVTHKGRILITRRPGGSKHAGMWEFPGGKLDPGESPQQGLRRELMEELSLEVETGDIYEVVYHLYDWGPVLILAYLCRPLSPTVQNIQVSEHRWVLPEELNDFNILPADRPIIEKLQAKPAGAAGEI
ncbi:(deoxy)nucleoside triphosphate pyrophosphohydrolase [Desulfuromonas sp. AOP6]|uniref:(deoxy)nucleoside triphosphate pyrophosphohydrolase n=1 Tax=Desulfuromonas sp. AOP6 TaxID=1566351 RepID=UPI001276CDFE|nr:(deoxy)nucleoside triphosphate pyrophosphohydrolase [Desulfuromonas sp. AOP6]BCA79160.1 DNA mismatch repair protein MutT [Desulfuromonas sp. AOP6]